ncbi:MAG: metalloregulator ArsR/SmtB family transcription factor [Tissierellaceae bacterium]|nr:metalloregulator ArsR/SmtB family transcription factor [Tissierellaceae bacterium]
MMTIIHKEPNWVYESASCISDYVNHDQQVESERQNKLGMSKKEMEDYFSKYSNYKESVLSEIIPIYEKYSNLEKYFKVTNIDNLITTIAGFLTFFMDDVSNLNNDHETIDKLINKVLSSLLDDHLNLPKDSDINIDNIGTLLNYLEQVDFDDKTKLLLINLYNSRYEVIEELVKLLKQCVPILKKHFYIIEEDFDKAVNSINKDDRLDSFIKKTLKINLSLSDNTEFYFSILNFSQMSMLESYDNRMISYIGIYLEDLVKLSEKNKFNDTQILSDLKAISDPTRLRIVGILANKKMYLQEIAEALDLAPSTISHHIQILLNSMLVSITVDAVNSRKVYYETNKEKVEELGDSIKNLVSNKIF